jgi:hypothetical protein
MGVYLTIWIQQHQIFTVQVIAADIYTTGKADVLIVPYDIKGVLTSIEVLYSPETLVI